jgi:hypothetical protein
VFSTVSPGYWSCLLGSFVSTGGNRRRKIALREATAMMKKKPPRCLVGGVEQRGGT